MKYQEFENGLKGMFDNAEEAVNIEALLSSIHNTNTSRDRKWLWFSLFGIITILGIVGINNVIEQNHQLVIDDQTSLLVKSTNTDAKTLNEASTIQQSNIIDKKAVITVEDNEKETNEEIIKSKSTIPSKKKSLPLKNRTNNHNKSNNVIIKKDLNRENKAFLNNNLVGTKGAEIIKSQASKYLKGASAERTAINLRKIESLTSLLDYDRSLPMVSQVDCPSFSNKLSWHFDIIPEIGYIVPLKTLSQNTSEPQEVFNIRNNDEQALEGLQAALYTRVRPGNVPYYLKFGASYTRLSERMNLNVNYIERDTTVGIISITSSQNGDTLTVITGDIITETEFNRQSVDHYYLHMIDIPIAIGYSKSIGNGWRFGGEVGAQFNISLGTKGKLLESSSTYTDLPASGRFLTNLGVSFFGGITLEKAISEKSAFYISPRFRYFPKEFTPQSYNISQQYQFAGLHAGYIYSF